jgi:hypothetical protein
VKLVGHEVGLQDPIETLILRDRDDGILVPMMELIRRPNRTGLCLAGAGPLTLPARTPPAVCEATRKSLGYAAINPWSRTTPMLCPCAATRV